MTTARLTNLSADDLEDFFLLLPRIYADYRDPRRGPLEMLYVYSETLDNEDSTFLRAVEMADAGLIKRLGIAEASRGYGYEGFDHSVGRLRAFGWEDRVPIVKFDQKEGINTLSEARALADWGRSHSGDIGIVAPAFHLARAFMTTVSAIREDPVRVYAYPGVAIPWSERVVHSQGKLSNTRAGLLGDELQRLEKYRAAECGNLMSARQVLDYLNWRDS